MRHVEITIEDATFAELDAASHALGVTPTEFVRRAAAAAVRSVKSQDARCRDVAGYATTPPAADEFAVDPDDLRRADDAAW